jgi:hypothetical protein
MSPHHLTLPFLLLFALSGCTTLRPIEVDEQLNAAEVTGKKVAYAVKPQCTAGKTAVVRSLQEGSLILASGESVPVGELCYLQRRQVEVNPLFYLKRAGQAIVSIPVVIIAAIAGAPCMIGVRC